ncbi:hypothetical protein [Martelella sp. HB161492]|uniref:hypothetical protein n=1 Tax=Martelella sp. HB161492 TaxID=2720726 RepID=UPI001591BAE3|nr:hypothetical protein [Martelella sp. HB161492]
MRFVVSSAGMVFTALLSSAPVHAAGPWDLPSGRQAHLAGGDVEISFNEQWGTMLIMEFYVPDMPAEVGYADDALFDDARILCERVAIPVAKELPDDIVGALVLMKPFDLRRGTYFGASYSDRLAAYEMPFSDGSCLDPRE